MSLLTNHAHRHNGVKHVIRLVHTISKAVRKLRLQLAAAKYGYPSYTYYHILTTSSSYDQESVDLFIHALALLKCGMVHGVNIEV